MKQIFTIALFFIICSSYSQTARLYNPEADVAADIRQGLVQAKAENKQLFLQIGGNWCPWCIKFHKMVHEDMQLDSILTTNYEVVNVNYSNENDNHEFLATLGYPQRFGFPVFVILDEKGNVIHIQDSWYLEQDKSYSREKVEHFFQMWSVYTIKEAATKFGKQ